MDFGPLLASRKGRDGLLCARAESDFVQDHIKLFHQGSQRYKPVTRSFAKFEVPTAVTMKITVSWDVTSYILVERYCCLEGMQPPCLPPV
jgi:hypothetical protein